jgi:hypothetical protein
MRIGVLGVTQSAALSNQPGSSLPAQQCAAVSREGLLHEGVFVHNKSDAGYQEKSQQPDTVVDHTRELCRQLRLP